ncbi:endoglucanase, partial [Marivirga lumbricoides]
MEHFNRTIKKNTSLFVMMLLFSAFFIQVPAQGQYIKTQGTQIVGPNGQPFQMVGINLGNWLVWEGYLMMGDFQYRTHTQFFNSVKDAFGGNLQQAMEFEHQWRLNYVNMQSITELGNMGFNSVRVPFHYNLFWNGSGLTDRGFQY